MNHTYNGKIINYSDSMKLPTRNNFIDNEINKNEINKIKNNEEFYFNSFTNYEKNCKLSYTEYGYKLILFGALQCGSKACVILDDCEIFFDIRIPDDVIDKIRFYKEIHNIIFDNLPDYAKYKTDFKYKFVKHKPLKGFVIDELEYIRLYFNTTSERKNVLDILKYDFNNNKNSKYSIIKYTNKNNEISYKNDSKNNILETVEDDPTSYGNKYYLNAARHHKFNLTGWNIIKKYKYINPDNESCKLYNSYNKEGIDFIKTDINFIFIVSIKDIVSIEDAGIDISQDANLFNYKIMTACWDLETYSNIDTGTADNQEDTKNSFIFLDSMVFSWQYSNDDFLRVCLTTIPCINRDDCLIIRCNNQKELILAKMQLLEKMKPDLIMGFNDSKYDWPFLYARAKLYNIQLDLFKSISSIYLNDTDLDGKYADKYYFGYHPQKIKISSEIEEKGCMSLILPGIISMDVRFVLWKMFSNQDGKCSLAFCLNKFNLGTKEDISYRTLFRIYNICKQFKLYYKINNIEFDNKGCIDYINNIGYNLSDSYNESTDVTFNKLINIINYIIKKYGEDYKPFNNENYEQKYEVHLKTIKEIKDIIGGELFNGPSNMGINQAINYCNIDSKKCQDLLVAANILNDKREIATISYTSLFESFYRADGIRVYNLVLATAFKKEWNLVCSSNFIKNDDKNTYPGAYVVVPKKGLYRDCKCDKFNKIKSIENTNTDIENENENENENNEQLLDIFNNIYNKTPETIINEYFPQYHRNENGDHDNGSDDILKNNDTNLISDRPCVGLDFSSLYPSVEMTYNLSPEKIIFNEEDYAKYKKMGLNILLLSFPYGKKEDKEENKKIIKVYVIQHNHPIRKILNKDFPSTEEFKNNWFSKCDNDKKTTLNKLKKQMDSTTLDEWKEYGMGIYPYILKQLFIKRSIMKKSLFKYEEMIEILSSVVDSDNFSYELSLIEQKQLVINYCDNIIQQQQNNFKNNPLPIFKTNEEKFKRGKDNIMSEWNNENIYDFIENCEVKENYYDIKQKSLKVYMNTFYGITGAKTNALGVVEVAGGTTVKGKYNTKMVKNYIENKGMRVLYGDTDSLYISLKDDEFKDLDYQYYHNEITKKEYWEGMIYKTMRFMDSFKNEVNTLLFIDNTTTFLKMAYEEVLYPFVLSGKKKYMGIQHLQIVNLRACEPDISLEEFMKSKSIFTRGFEIIKRGVSEFLKLVFYEIIKNAFCLTETRTLKQICEDSLRSMHNKKWDPMLFSKTKRYKLPGNKPDGTKKQGNITVLNFIDKMKKIQNDYPEIKLEIPELGIRYKYVVVKRYPYTYNIKGLKENIKMHDRHEFLEMFNNENYKKIFGNLEIDLDYYITNELIGQLSRLVIYHNYYDTFSKNGMSDDELKTADEKAMDNAKKILIKHYNTNFSTKYKDRSDIHKNIYKKVQNIHHRKLINTYNINDNIYKKITSKNISVYVENNYSILDEIVIENIFKIIMDRIETLSNNIKKTIPKLQIIKNLEKMNNCKYLAKDRNEILFNRFICGENNIVDKLLKELFNKTMIIKNKIRNNIIELQKTEMINIKNIKNSINKVNNYYNLNNLGIEPNREDKIIKNIDDNIIINFVNEETSNNNEKIKNVLLNFNDNFIEAIYYKSKAKSLKLFKESINNKRIGYIKNNISCSVIKEYNETSSFGEQFYLMLKDIV